MVWVIGLRGRTAGGRSDLVSAFSWVSGEGTGPDHPVAVPGTADGEGKDPPDLGRAPATARRSGVPDKAWYHSGRDVHYLRSRSCACRQAPGGRGKDAAEP